MSAAARTTAHWRHALACVAALGMSAALVTSCGGGPDASELAGPVEIVVDIKDIEHWEAHGPLVDDGGFCPAGRRQLVAVFDPDTGAPISAQRFFLMDDDLTSPAARPDVLVLIDHICDDGSGAFLVAENLHRDSWEIRSGTGQYAAMTGRGTASFVVDLQANPSQVHVMADIGINR